MKIFFAILLASAGTHAAVDVAFLEVRNHQGEILRLEPGGRFAHVAISYGNKWLHAHPLRGVEVISEEELMKIGEIKSVVHLTDKPEITPAQVRPFLGKPYDDEFSWDNDKFYCSEILGILLGIPPEPMTFQSEYWRNRYKHLEGKPGLSPDDIYRYLQPAKINSCWQTF